MFRPGKKRFRGAGHNDGPYGDGPAVAGRVEGGVRLDEVYLSGSTRQGPAVVGGLALVADDRGLTVLGPQPTSVMTMPWGRATSITLRQPATLPDGRGAVALEVGVEGRALRFFVPESGLGPEGAGALGRDLSALERVPPIVLSPKPAVRVPPPPPARLAPPPAAVVADAQGAEPVGIQSGGVPGARAGAEDDDHQVGDDLGSVPVGNHLQLSRPRVRLKVVAALLALLAAGGAGVVYVLQVRNGGTGTSQDSLVASEVNIEPGDLPGWRGVAGTVAGALGASGFRTFASGDSRSAAGSPVPVRAVAGFERCAGISPSEADAALTVLGFSEGLAPVAYETAAASSPLFEDPSAPSTTTTSSVMVFGTTHEETAEMAAIARQSFAGCYSRFLDSVVPDLDGGAMSGVPLSYVAITPARPTSVTAGVSAVSYSEAIVRSGHPSRVALHGTVDAFGSGRVIAVVETISPRPFSASLRSRLLTSVEQGVSGESSGS